MEPQESPQGITRRQAIKTGLAGAAALACLDPSQAMAAKGAAPIRAGARHAKSVIQIWAWGGPSHLDTFDPKPDAGYDYTGPLKSPIKTNVDGIMIGELLPELAKQADKFSIIRSMTHGNNSHETAAYLMQTGRMPDRLTFPSVGAVVSKFKGHDAGYEGLAPPYIVLTRSQGRFSEAGFLGQRFKPFCTGGDPNAARFVVEGIVQQGISDDRQRSRRKLMHSLDSLGKAMPDSEAFKKLDQTEAEAYDMMFGKARELFDLSKESDEMRERYGRTTFGQSCLMARRLVEAGVPHVTINSPGWDTHKQHFENMRRRLPDLDRGMAALLADLASRGLLDSTIVWWGGEFGRGPRVQWEAPWNGGRSHYGKVFSVVLAGGGFKGGTVVGGSTDKGTEVAQRPVYPRDLIGSIYQRLGIDPQAPLPNPRNLDVTVLPKLAKGEPTGGYLTEIMPS